MPTDPRSLVDLVEAGSNAPVGPLTSTAPAGFRPPAPAGGNGFDWRQLIQMVGPVLGGLVAKGGPAQSGFQEGWMHGQQLANQERAQREQVQQRKGSASAEFLMEIAKQAEQYDDPVALHDFLGVAGEAYQHAGLGNASDIVDRFKVPASRAAEKRLKELTDQIDQAEKAGLDLDEMAQSHSYFKLKDGSQVPVDVALDMTRKRPYDASGKPVAKPKKTDVAASTDYGRFLAKFAKDKGKKVDDLTAAEELDAKKQYNTIDDKPPAPPGPGSDYAQALNRFAKSLGKSVDQLTSADEVTFKKIWGQADDRPREPSGRGPGGLLPSQEFGISEKLAKAWTDTTKAQREMNRQFQLMQTGLKRFNEGDKNGGSQAVLVTFQKVLDPSSVVRESEYARSSQGISLLSRLEGYADRLKSGGAGVPAKELEGMVETARQFLADMQGYTAGQRKRIEAQTKKYGIDPATVFDDVATGAGDAVKVGGFTVKVKK